MVDGRQDVLLSHDALDLVVSEDLSLVQHLERVGRPRVGPGDEPHLPEGADSEDLVLREIPEFHFAVVELLGTVRVHEARATVERVEAFEAPQHGLEAVQREHPDVTVLPGRHCGTCNNGGAGRTSGGALIAIGRYIVGAKEPALGDFVHLALLVFHEGDAFSHEEQGEALRGNGFAGGKEVGSLGVNHVLDEIDERGNLVVVNSGSVQY
mmetsp:Transcript_45607/g.84543  ORF Transcript_45607/g.84543 Transcript_45607/m.84543 type:complete len:210 (+) Transcript_45607:521-1150(+)